MALLERRFAASRVPLSLILLAIGVALAAGATAAEATFPGSNGRLAFSAQAARPGYAQNTFLYDFNPATGKLRQLTSRPEGCGRSWVDGGLDYSPDGRRLAYVHGDECPGSAKRSGLWIMSANGRGKRHVASFDLYPEEALTEADAAFSPNGRAVAVVHRSTDPRGSNVVTVFRLPGGVVARQTFLAGYPDGMDWGADGRIALSLNGRLHVLAPDGTGQRKLNLKPGWGTDVQPDWSPNGVGLAFERSILPDDDTPEVPPSIWRGFPQTNTALLLIKGSIEAPTFSPDGRHIAAWDDSRIVQFSSRSPGQNKQTLLDAPDRIQWIVTLSWQPRALLLCSRARTCR